jgi:hypothetical protein
VAACSGSSTRGRIGILGEPRALDVQFIIPNVNGHRSFPECGLPNFPMWLRRGGGDQPWSGSWFSFAEGRLRRFCFAGGLTSDVARAFSGTSAACWRSR